MPPVALLVLPPVLPDEAPVLPPEPSDVAPPELPLLLVLLALPPAQLHPWPWSTLPPVEWLEFVEDELLVHVEPPEVLVPPPPEFDELEEHDESA